jgi:PAS domain-containing protein
MAPEQIRHEPPQPSMDLYSVGILLYEMATGEPPFMGTVDDVLVAHLNRPVPPLGGARAQDLDPQLEAIILKALEKDPARRQPSMGQLLYELRTVADMLGLASGRAGGGRRATGVARELLAPRPHCNLCPFPTVRVDPELRIVSANAAFLAFVNLAGESLLGTRIDRTRLQGIYPGLAEDLQTVFRSGKMVQRALRFQPASREALSVLVTLVPDAGPDAAGAPRLACGVVIPLA